MGEQQTGVTTATDEELQRNREAIKARILESAQKRQAEEEKVYGKPARLTPRSIKPADKA